MCGAGTTRASGGELDPSRAPVTPRGRWWQTKASLPLERLLLERIQSQRYGRVVIVAPPGGGKTTALRHLRAALPADAQLEFVDSSMLEAFGAPSNWLVIATAADVSRTAGSLDVIELSAWTLDDCTEYLAAVHRGQCASVLSRLKEDQSLALANGSPQLLTLIMDAMAGDATLTSSREVLRRQLGQVVPPGWNRDRTQLDWASHSVLTEDQLRWWRHAGIQKVFTAEWATDQLYNGVVPEVLRSAALVREWAPEIAAAARRRPEALEFLAQIVRTTPRDRAVPMAASILLSADPNWRPESGVGLYLARANLPWARWANIDLSNSTLTYANFAGADLNGANLSDAEGGAADFTGTNLSGAMLKKAWLCNANFEAANLCGAIFARAKLEHANLSGAQCKQANFSEVNFSHVILDDADFSGANFEDAFFGHVDLRPAKWTGASFVRADLHQCNLEGMDLPSADFSHANLTASLFTGSRIRGGNFRGATLRQTGLADIDWEEADLRDADLTNASFHLGSTRSGLVGSNIPCEGSRTGFYTDDYQEQNFKDPEEIRKACLCGANLLGAKVEGTDFYLVDLRQAVYSPDQENHFIRTRAILASPKA
jgi:uncharacterized protein YjbI with pentapeptide repeats